MTGTDRSARRVVLGGIGGDAHSVGMIILSRVLARAGYAVRYLGTQNSPHELCAAALGADAVLVSNMDGHAGFYLRDLPMIRAGADRALWYLGGNPSVTGDVADLHRLGFARVFPGYVESAEVVRLLDLDLGVSGGTERPLEAPRRAARRQLRPPPTPEQDEREQVLAQWPTGAAARDLGANARALAAAASLAAAQHAADRVLIHPRSGVGDRAEQRSLFRALRGAGADVLSFQVDSMTRNNAYGDVEQALKSDDGTALNGYPVVNHGVGALRELSAEFHDVPLQVRHSTRDPRLLAEITFAGGIPAFEGGAITYNLPYFRDYPPVESLARWRYVDTLAGTYHRRFGVVIDREFFGTLTASLVPPCLAVVVNVLEALLAAAAGVRSVTLGYAEQGHRGQDVGAVRALRRVAARYLAAAGHPDVAVHTVFHQYMGAFPLDPVRAREVLAGSAGTAARSGADRIMVKTCVEAVRIPTPRDNTDAIGVVAAALRSAAAVTADPEADAEEELIVAEATAILDAMLAAGRAADPRDPVGAAVVEGIARGLLDVPFSPSRWNAGVALSVRDAGGAVRFAETGAVPLPPAVRDHHRTLVDHRLRTERRAVAEILEDDLVRVSRGQFAGWPLTAWADATAGGHR